MIESSQNVRRWWNFSFPHSSFSLSLSLPLLFCLVHICILTAGVRACVHTFCVHVIRVRVPLSIVLLSFDWKAIIRRFVEVEVLFYEKRTNTIVNLPSFSCVYVFSSLHSFIFFLAFSTTTTTLRCLFLLQKHYTHFHSRIKIKDTNIRNTSRHLLIEWLTGWLAREICE